MRPQVSGWRPIAQLAPEIPITNDLARNLLSWVLGCAMVYCALFGVGKLALGPRWMGGLLLVSSVLCALLLSRNLAKTGWGPAVPAASATVPVRAVPLGN